MSPAEAVASVARACRENGVVRAEVRVGDVAVALILGPPTRALPEPDDTPIPDDPLERIAADFEKPLAERGRP